MSRRMVEWSIALVLGLQAPRAVAQQEAPSPAPDEEAPPPTPEPGPTVLGVVDDLVVVGTEKTLPETVQAYARLDPGDTLTSEELPRVERRLVATGLFQSVKVSTQPTGEGHVRVVLAVEDKASWVVAPTFSVSNSNIGGGVLYAESNLWGRSKKFAAALQVSTAESGLFVGFLDPNLFGFPQVRLTFEGQARSDRVEEYRPDASQPVPEVVRRTRLNSASAASELSVMIAERVRVGAKYRVMLIDAQPPSQDTPVTAPAFEPGPVQRDASLRLVVGVDTRQNLQAIMEGLNIEGSLELSNPGVWSDFRYKRFGLLYRHGIRFFEEHNLVLRGEAVAGTELPFHQELVAGASSLRGFLYRQFRGDTRLSFTAEYHFPLFTIRSLSFRGVGFSDTGMLMWRSLPADLQLRDVKGRVVRGYLPDAKSGLDGATVAQGVGVGLRLFLRSVVLPLVGVDVAYGVNSGEIRFYVVAGVSPS
ncbi:MAG: BamA/TamA family outer membrane protein [Hyalangium sp.]|uniref:BamA/TamA family outer membrane protein n=1 Tax=Hyalangium sp. TaxID=2028555 RepID=UPI00389AAE5A